MPVAIYTVDTPLRSLPIDSYWMLIEQAPTVDEAMKRLENSVDPAEVAEIIGTRIQPFHYGNQLLYLVYGTLIKYKAEPPPAYELAPPSTQTKLLGP
jgi:hypothetical protein